MTAVDVCMSGASASVAYDQDGVSMRLSGANGHDLSVLVTPAEAIELSRALAFVAGLARKDKATPC